MIAQHIAFAGGLIFAATGIGLMIGSWGTGVLGPLVDPKTTIAVVVICLILAAACAGFVLGSGRGWPEGEAV